MSKMNKEELKKWKESLTEEDMNKLRSIKELTKEDLVRMSEDEMGKQHTKNKIKRFIKGLNKLCDDFNFSICAYMPDGESAYIGLWDSTTGTPKLLGNIMKDEEYCKGLSKEKIEKIKRGRPCLPVKYLLDKEENE